MDAGGERPRTTRKADGLDLGTTILSPGGRTVIPDRVMEVLRLEPALNETQKVLWTEADGEVVVSKGTPQSSFRKTLVSRDGMAAVPKHIRKALGLETGEGRQDSLVWMRRGDEVVVRKGQRC